MDINEIKRILKTNKKSLSDKYGIIRIGIFGSYTLNLQNEKSDIDIAIEMDKKKKNIHNFFAAKRFLEQQLGRNVDVGFEHSLKPSVKKSIETNMIYV